MPETEFIELKDWLKLNKIELDEEKETIKCVNMPDDWHEDEEEELEEEE